MLIGSLLPLCNEFETYQGTFVNPTELMAV